MLLCSRDSGKPSRQEKSEEINQDSATSCLFPLAPAVSFGRELALCCCQSRTKVDRMSHLLQDVFQP
jgi:hypothetical protein